jgi:uncharacterized membrane protein YbhN (UPF0104 family)
MNRVGAALPAGKRLTRLRSVKKLLSIALLCMVVVLLAVLARRIEWGEVWQALAEYDAATLLLAGAAMCCSYAIYSTFDLIGRRYTQHGLPRHKVMIITFVCYAFTQSMTAWVGGIALRYRLYTRKGLTKSVVAQIFAISLITNWIGYLTLAGVLALAGAVPIAGEWPVGRTAVRFCGALLLAVPVIYLYCCYRYSGRRLQLFGHHWQALDARTGALQIVIGAANWAAMATVIYLLLLQQVAYPTVLSILLLSSIAAAIVHIPAGLGVLEGLFLLLLGNQLGRGEILAALIAYRAIYYLVPLIPAAIIYFSAEFRTHREKARDRKNGKAKTA